MSSRIANVQNQCCYLVPVNNERVKNYLGITLVALAALMLVAGAYLLITYGVLPVEYACSVALLIGGGLTLLIGTSVFIIARCTHHNRKPGFILNEQRVKLLQSAFGKIGRILLDPQTGIKRYSVPQKHCGENDVFELSKIPGVIFKSHKIEPNNKFIVEKYVQLRQKAVQICQEHHLHLLTVPKCGYFQIGQRYVIWEEKLDLVPNQQAACREELEINPALAEERLKQIAILICLLKFSDVKLDNIPQTTKGQTGLIDIDDRGAVQGLCSGGAWEGNDGLFSLLLPEMYDRFVALAKSYLSEEEQQQFAQVLKEKNIFATLQEKETQRRQYQAFLTHKNINSVSQSIQWQWDGHTYLFPGLKEKPYQIPARGGGYGGGTVVIDGVVKASIEQQFAEAEQEDIPLSLTDQETQHQLSDFQQLIKIPLGQRNFEDAQRINNLAYILHKKWPLLSNEDKKDIEEEILNFRYVRLAEVLLEHLNSSLATKKGKDTALDRVMEISIGIKADFYTLPEVKDIFREYRSFQVAIKNLLRKMVELKVFYSATQSPVPGMRHIYIIKA